MKRFVLFALLTLGIVAFASAQGWGHHGRGHGPGIPRHGELGRRNQQFTREAVTVSGDLTLVQGFLAVRSGDINYLAMGLNRYIGFIDSLRHGARVNLEGTAIINPRDANTRYLLVSKLTIDGRDYDLERPWHTWRNDPPRQNRQMPHNRRR